MRQIVLFLTVITTIGFAHLSISACMCPGVNPEVYPPDIRASRTYYRNNFKDAAFTGKLLSSKEVSDPTGQSIQELTVMVDRYWFGVDRQVMTIYAPEDKTGCWVPFRESETYFFIPTFEKGFLYIGACTYASYNRKPDGNYVDFMVAMFGKGKKFKTKRKQVRPNLSISLTDLQTNSIPLSFGVFLQSRQPKSVRAILDSGVS